MVTGMNHDDVEARTVMAEAFEYGGTPILVAPILDDLLRHAYWAALRIKEREQPLFVWILRNRLKMTSASQILLPRVARP